MQTPLKSADPARQVFGAGNIRQGRNDRLHARRKPGPSIVSEGRNVGERTPLAACAASGRDDF